MLGRLCLILISCMLLAPARAKELSPFLEKYGNLLYDDPRHAIEVYRREWEKTKITGSHDEKFALLVRLIAAHAHHGQYDGVKELMQEAAKLDVGSTNYDLKIRHAVQKIWYAKILGEEEKIDELTEAAKDLLPKSQDNLTKALALTYVIDHHARKGELEIAAAMRLEFLKLLQNAEKTPNYYAMLNNLGIMLTAYRFQYDKSGVAILEEVASYAEANGLRFLMLLAYSSLATIHQTEGRLPEAEAALIRLQELAKALNDPIGISDAIEGQIGVKLKLKQYKEAMDLLQKNSSLLRAQTPDEAAQISVLKAHIHLGLKQYADALATIDSHLLKTTSFQFDPSKAETLQIKATALHQLGRYELAAEVYQELIKIKDHVNAVQTQKIQAEYAAQFGLSNAIAKKLDSEIAAEKAKYELESRTFWNRVMAVMIVCLIAISLAAYFEFHRIRRSNRAIREMQRYISTSVLQRFLPPVMVEEILAGRSRLDEKAHTSCVTILFADLCQFTQATDQLGPEIIAGILNDFFQEMSEVVFAEGGTIDKFIGDAIMVLFGAASPLTPEDQAARAIACARNMQAKLECLNQNWQASHNYSFQMRIGIHQGQAIVGSFGGPKRSDYTVVGTPVNTAARIESVTRPGSIYVSETIVSLLPKEHFISVGHFRLKGLDKEVNLYTVARDQIKQAS